MLVRPSVCVVSLLILTACQKADSATPVDASPAEPADEADVVEEEAPTEDSEAPEEPEQMLTVTIFEETVQGNMQDILDCYAEAQSKNAKLAGTLKASFVVDAEGKVTEVTASGSSTLKDDGMLSCIQSKAAAWDLPRPPKAPTNFTFPFELAPAG